MKSDADIPANEENKVPKTKMVIVADLGRFKAYRWEESQGPGRPRLTFIEERQTEVTHRLSEDLTDQAGRYRKEPAVPGALSDGEEHNLELERRHRAIKFVADNIAALVERENAEACYLAADARIQEPILEELDTLTLAKIEKCLAANLSKASPQELIERFG